MNLVIYQQSFSNYERLQNKILRIFTLRDILLCVFNILLTIYTLMFVDFCAHRHAHAILSAWIQAPVHFFSKGA